MPKHDSAELRQPYTVERLPWLAKLHRNAFRSGRHDVSETAKFASRVAFYCGQSLWPWPVHGELGVDVAGERKQFAFDARNRMFSAVYFDKFSGGYEPPVVALVDGLMPDDGVFYDIGSNWGYFSIFLACRPNFTGQVHAFEPWPTTFADLASVVDQLGLKHVVRCHNFAVGSDDQDGNMQCGTHSGCAKLVADESSGLAVMIRPIDQLDLPPPDLLKIDTEGHEEQVFAGANATLRHHRPMIIFEHRYELFLDAESQRTSLEMLQSLGYRLYLPSWNGQMDYGDGIRADAADTEGLRLTECTSRTRFAHPECPDLFACPSEKVDLLNQRGWIAPNSLPK